MKKVKSDVKTDYAPFFERFFRWIRWLFFKSGVISLALEHFLAMIPATILVPVIVNSTFKEMVIDISLVLFTSGIGTIAFIIISKGTIPAYLGSSFAYIGLTVYLIEEQMNTGTSDYNMAFTYVGWAYIFSGILLFLLSFLYMKKGIERFLSFILPATVVGPAISLIGLELADTAIVDSGFDIEEGLVNADAAIVSVVTLAVIVLFSLIRHRILKNTAIIVGMVVGCTLSFCINGFPTDYLSDIQWFTVPRFNFPVFSIPDNLMGLFIAVIPSTLIVFTENIGRITVIGRMTGDKEEEKEQKAKITKSSELIDDDTGENDIFTKKSVKKMRTSIASHGLTMFLAGFIGSVPNTIYAENIAVMSIHKTDMAHEDPDPVVKKIVDPYSHIPYIIAALFAVAFSFIGVLQTILMEIPDPVIGGMELFLFGIISAPGIQLLVEQRVNYKKISNQIITAAVLISGISGLSINFGIVELSGMSLGFVVGIVLNIIVQALKWIGNISDQTTFDELAAECLSCLPDNTELRVLGYKKYTDDASAVSETSKMSVYVPGFAYALSGKDCRVKINGQWISDDTIRDDVLHCDLIELGLPSDREPLIRFRKTANGLFVDIKGCLVDKRIKDAYLNDYKSIDEDGEWMLINCGDDIPVRRVKNLILKVNGALKSSEKK